jgi:hypothetical protein
MNDFTPKELAYILVLQGILSSSDRMRTYQYEVVDNAITIVDILFDRIEAKRKEQGAA